MNNPRTFLYTDIGVEVVELSPTEWRVSDLRRPHNGGGFALIGFIKQAEAGFEVTESVSPGRRATFKTFTEALTLLSQHRDPSRRSP